MIRFVICLLGAIALTVCAATAKQPAEFKEAYETYANLVQKEKFRDAIPYARKALEIALKSGTFSDEMRGKLAFNLGYVKFRDRQLSDAADEFGRAIDWLRKADNDESDLIAQALVYRGNCFALLAKRKEAADNLEKALELLDGPDRGIQLLRAEALETLAWVMVQEGRRNQAEESAKQALEISSRFLPERHPRVLRVKVVLAAALYMKGRRGTARDMLARAIADTEKAGLVPEGSNTKTEPQQFTVEEMISFHRMVGDLYHLMNRDSDSEHHYKIVSDLKKGIRPGPFRVKAIERRPPSYPRRAAMKAQPGWALVEFTVRKDGTTSDIRVIDAAPEGYFEKASVHAVKSWKYEPPTEDGKPVDVPGVRTMIMYIMEN